MKDKKTILLAEDDAFVRDIYIRKLTQENFEVIATENGMDAIEKLKKQKPDLVILDIMMPYMDGREVLEKLKANKEWKNIPVILLTNISDKDDVEEGLTKADKYLIKSHFSPSEVVEKVKTLI